MSPIPPATSFAEALPPRWVRVRWVARALLGLVIIAWSLLLIAWLTLHWGILPHIQQWREPIQERASKALGVPVQIGQIGVRSSGWVPSFELREVVLLGPDQRPALRLPRVFAAVSVRSLLSLELHFEQLLIDGAELEVRRDRQGRIFVAGLDFSGADLDKDSGSAAADWFFAQHEFVIRAGALRWSDELRDAAPLALADVQLVVRNGLRRHEMRIDATPPAEWGDRFSATGRFTQPLLARRGDWRRWSGSAYASLPRADVHALRQHVALPFELSEGVGALRGWFDMTDGQPSAATIDVALRAVNLRLAQNVDPLVIEEVQGRVVAQRTPDAVTLGVQHASFLTGDNIRWPEGDLALTWRQREGQPASGGEFSAQRLDLGLIAQIASRVPLGDALRKLLAELNPQGVVRDLSLKWDGPVDAPTHYRAQGELNGLSLAAHPSSESGGVGRPGLRNATIELDATETGGTARVAIDGGVIDLPGVFDDPALPLDQFSAQLLWKIEPPKLADQPPKIAVQVKNARFSNPDARGELNVSWSSGSGAGISRGGHYPGRLELDAKLSDGHAERAWRYLPLGLSRETREYLQHAVQGGKLVSANFRVNGDLWDFPFFNAKSNKDGEFRITAKVEDGSYAFVPSVPASAGNPGHVSPWPVLTKADVELALDRGTLTLSNGRAQLGNIEFRNVQGAIRNLETEGQLAIETNARGPLAEMLRVVNTTPVGGWIGKALDASTGSGNAELKLALGVPLMHFENATAKGSVTLAGNDVRITPDSPLLGGAKGRVDFSNKTFAVVGASAKVYGGDLTFDGGLQTDGSVRFNGQGTVTADGLRRATEFGQVARLATALNGQTAYRANLGFVRGAPEVSITSNLVGLAVDLPAPLNKTADAPLALRYQSALDAPIIGQPARDTLRLELGSLVQAVYHREVSGDQPRVLRGGIGVMEPAPEPVSGVGASINLKTLATDEWEKVADRLVGSADAPDAGGKATYSPDSINLRVQELTAGTRRLTRVSAGLSQEAGGLWRANVDSDQLNGYVEYRPPSRRGGVAAAGGRVHARLSRLSLPKSDVEQVESLLDQQPATLPALDVVVEDFELRGKHLGRVEIDAVNRVGVQGREWQLTKFNITTPEAQLTATGQWAAAGAAFARGAPAPRRALMDFKLVLTDSGALLDRLGTSKAIRSGKGQLSGQIAWQGSPFALDYPSLSGQINVAIEAGQFLKAEPGAARLLGVLSLQSLPRRLSLDFRDLFQEGFAFDSFTGDVSIAQGVATTNNLRMRGVQAAVLMEGSADVARETQDLRVVVVPEINAGTAALAYAVINPAIGLGAFLAQAILKKPLTAAGTREFRVTGPWADPKVDRVERKFSDDVPAVDAPASAPPKTQ
ncbi:MAG: YhdP family protein [Burkholderiales bacterium]